ncbi:MAG TPA: cupin domain-containing protein [Coleofasciculaceae cyanobacterium]
MLNSTTSQATESSNLSATVFRPQDGKIFDFLGNTLTFKSSDRQDWRFFEAIGSAGARTPLHTHPWDEGFYILAGEIDIYIEDQRVSAGPGCCIQIPAGTAHGSQIRSPHVKLLNWVSDISAEQFIQEMAQQSDPLAMLAIRQKYQVLSVAPEAIDPSRPFSVFQPHQGQVFSVLGDTLTCKSSSSHTQGWRFFELVGAAGSGAPLHTHPWDAGLYLLAGEIEVQLQDHTVQATPGYCIQIPAGTVHTVQIRSPQAKLLAWSSDTRAEQCFAELDQAAPAHPDQAIAIRQKHRIAPVQIAVK